MTPTLNNGLRDRQRAMTELDPTTMVNCCLTCPMYYYMEAILPSLQRLSQAKLSKVEWTPQWCGQLKRLKELEESPASEKKKNRRWRIWGPAMEQRSKSKQWPFIHLTSNLEKDVDLPNIINESSCKSAINALLYPLPNTYAPP